MTVTYILWVVLDCIIFSVMVAGSDESSGEAPPPPPPPSFLSIILGNKKEMTSLRHRRDLNPSPPLFKTGALTN